MDIAYIIGAMIGGCTLLGFVIRGSNSLARIEVMMTAQQAENAENKSFRSSTDKMLSSHANRIQNLETDVSEIRG